MHGETSKLDLVSNKEGRGANAMMKLFLNFCYKEMTFYLCCGVSLNDKSQRRKQVNLDLTI